MDNAFKTPPSSPSKAVQISPAQPIIASPIAGMPTFYYHPGSAGKSHGLTPTRTKTVSLPKHRGPAHRFIKNWRGDIISEHTLPSNSQEIFESLCAQLKNLKSRFNGDFSMIQTRGYVDKGHFFAAKLRIEQCISCLIHCYLEAPNKTYFLYLLNHEIFSNSIYNPFGLKKIYNGNAIDMSIANNPHILAGPLTPWDFPTPVVMAPYGLFASAPIPAAKKARLSSTDSSSTMPSSDFTTYGPR